MPRCPRARSTSGREPADISGCSRRPAPGASSASTCPCRCCAQGPPGRATRLRRRLRAAVPRMRRFDLVCSSLMVGDVADLRAWVARPRACSRLAGTSSTRTSIRPGRHRRWRRTFGMPTGRRRELAVFSAPDRGASRGARGLAAGRPGDPRAADPGAAGAGRGRVPRRQAGPSRVV